MNWGKFLEDNPQITVDEVIRRTEGPPLEVIGTDDLEAEIDLLYERGREPGFGTGWPSLDVHYRIAPAFWTLVTGWPNMGKSSWVDNLAVNTMVKHDWKWLFFSAENQPYESHWAGLAELYIGMPFNKEHPMRMSRELKDQAKLFLRDHCWHIRPDENGLTVKRLLDVASRSFEQRAINCLVIDPWNELDHSRPYNVPETEYVSSALSQIRSFARRSGIHVFVVAHPTKLGRDKDGKLPVPTPHDVAGSSHFWNKADYAICIWRDFNDLTGENFVFVQKARHRWVGRLGKVSLFYEARTNSFVDKFAAPRTDRRYEREPGEEG